MALLLDIQHDFSRSRVKMCGMKLKRGRDPVHFT